MHQRERKHTKTGGSGGGDGALLRENSLGHQGQLEVGKASGSLEWETGHKKNRNSKKKEKPRKR